MHAAVINCEKITSREELFSEIYSALDIKGARGSNIDALFDTLCELDGCRLRFENAPALESALGAYAGRFFSALSDMSCRSAELEIEII